MYLPAQRNRQPARPTPQTEAPTAPKQSDPLSRVTFAQNMESSPHGRFLLTKLDNENIDGHRYTFTHMPHLRNVYYINISTSL